jgi:hypothetical protein
VPAEKEALPTAGALDGRDQVRPALVIALAADEAVA